MMYGSTPANQNSQNTGMATPITSMSESSTVSRTTMPAETTPSSIQSTSEIHQNSSHSGPPICCVHVHKSQSQACKLGEPPALRKVKTPHNGKTSMNRSPLAKQEISSQFSSCFEGIGCFPGDPYKFHLQPDHQMARHASKKQGIPKEVNEHADWVHSNIFVEKALEREPCYTHSTGETTIQQNFQGEWNMPDISQHTWKCAWMTSSLRPQREPNNSIFKTSAMQNSHQAWKTHHLSQRSSSCRKREKHGYRYIHIRDHCSEQAPCTQQTHTSRKSSTELPATEDGKFQHGGTSMLQLQC